MSTQKPIVVIGSINMDLVARTSVRPAPGETVLGHDFATVPGGKGANQAVAAARLGADVHMVGRVGDDAFGRDLLDGLQNAGVHTKHVASTSDTASGVALIIVDDTGENSILVIPGANALLTPADIDAATSVIASAACVIMQLEIPYQTIDYTINLCRQLGVYTILDPAPAPTAMPESFFQVDLLTPNQAEARTILGDGKNALDDITVGKQLLKRGAKTVVLKLGSNGAMVFDNAGLTAVESFAVKPVDTTAAGDAFTAALAVGLSEKMILADAVKFANAAGALACTVMGAQPSLPTRAAVDALRLTAH